MKQNLSFPAILTRPVNKRVQFFYLVNKDTFGMPLRSGYLMMIIRKSVSSADGAEFSSLTCHHHSGFNLN